MITTGAISISKIMWANPSLQKLYIGGGNIDDDDISRSLQEHLVTARVVNCLLISVVLLLLKQNHFLLLPNIPRVHNTKVIAICHFGCIL